MIHRIHGEGFQQLYRYEKEQDVYTGPETGLLYRPHTQQTLDFVKTFHL
jgi:hypothetical protein